MIPYVEQLIHNISYRVFSEDIDQEELVWHRDREDREVVALHSTDWQIQLDNKLPEELSTIFIPKGVYHRIIKGTGSLKVKIRKYYSNGEQEEH